MQAITTSELLLQQIADDLTAIRRVLAPEPPVVVDVKEPAVRPARKKTTPAKKPVTGR